MPAQPALAPAPPAAQSCAALPPPAPILARIARGGPAALEDHELLALLGIRIPFDCNFFKSQNMHLLSTA